MSPSVFVFVSILCSYLVVGTCLRQAVMFALVGPLLLSWLENGWRLVCDPEPVLYVNERVPAGGSWTISPFFLVEHCLPLCLNLRLDLVFLSRLYWPPSGHCFYIVQFLAVSSRRHLRHLRVCSHPPPPPPQTTHK